MSNDSRLDKLRNRLYDNKQPDAEHHESTIVEEDSRNLPTEWRGDEKKGGGRSILTMFLLICSGLFIIAAGFAIFALGFNQQAISPSQVRVEISGPQTIRAGEASTFDISITNNNDVELESASLSVRFPDDTRAADGSGDPLRRFEEDLGAFEVDETKESSVDASLFGTQGQTRDIQVSVEYRVAESTAIFSADRVYEVEIGSLPVSLSIIGPDETTTDQPVTLEAQVASNASEMLQDVVLSVDYPFGFSVSETDPAASFRNSFFNLGSIEPAGEKTVTIRGAFTEGGAANEQNFRFETGLAASDGEQSVGTLFAAQSKTLALREPFVDFEIATDNASQALAPGADVGGTLRIESNLDSPLRGGEAILSLSGAPLDPSSIESDTGLYDRQAGTLSWNARSSSDLAEIAAGEVVQLNFSADVLEADDLPADARDLTLSGNFAAQSSQDTNLPPEITATFSEDFILATRLDVAIDTLVDAGPFENNGPTPPIAGEETEYAIHLAVSNSTSRVENAVLRAQVPAYVNIVDTPQRSTGSVNFNETTGELVWRIPEIAPDSQGGMAELYVPVAIRPGDNQVGETPPLLSNITFSGTDTEAGVTVSDIDIALPTTNPDDIGSSRESGEVRAN